MNVHYLKVNNPNPLSAILAVYAHSVAHFLRRYGHDPEQASFITLAWLEQIVVAQADGLDTKTCAETIEYLRRSHVLQAINES